MRKTLPVWIAVLALAVPIQAFAQPAPNQGAGTRAATQAASPAAADNFIRLTPDKTRTLRLPRDAASVIVTNPAHASVVLENPRLLIIMPRAPGSTSFTVLDSHGNRIAEKTVIVSASQTKYVRVRRVCGPNDPSCVAASYSYCPDGCYDVMPVSAETGSAAPPAPISAPANSNAPTQANVDDTQMTPEQAEAAKKDLSGDYYPGNMGKHPEGN